LVGDWLGDVQSIQGQPPARDSVPERCEAMGPACKRPSVALGSVAERGACAWDGRARVGEREKEGEREKWSVPYPGAGRARRVRVRTRRGRERERERERGGRAARLRPKRTSACRTKARAGNLRHDTAAAVEGEERLAQF
jgi:hypothetical protein